MKTEILDFHKQTNRHIGFRHFEKLYEKGHGLERNDRKKERKKNEGFYIINH